MVVIGHIYNLFNTGEELVNAHIANKLDIVFMDIELENKSIGFDVARILCRQNKNIAIIYYLIVITTFNKCFIYFFFHITHIFIILNNNDKILLFEAIHIEG